MLQARSAALECKYDRGAAISVTKGRRRSEQLWGTILVVRDSMTVFSPTFVKLCRSLKSNRISSNSLAVNLEYDTNLGELSVDQQAWDERFDPIADYLFTAQISDGGWSSQRLNGATPASAHTIWCEGCLPQERHGLDHLARQRQHSRLDDRSAA